MSNQYYFFFHFHPSRTKNFLPCKWGVRFKRRAFHLPNLMYKLSYRSMESGLRMIARPASSVQFVLAQPSDRRFHLPPPPARVRNLVEYHTNGRCTV